MKTLQDTYLSIAKEYNKAVALELLEEAIKRVDKSYDIATDLDNFLDTFENRFKVELLMFPSWSTKNKSYRVGQDCYTHIKIKKELSDCQ